MLKGQEKERSSKWYSDAQKYWDSREATDSAMLGGLTELSDIDAMHSSLFLSEFLNNGMIKSRGYACDCGAGIGRVTRTFLLKHFEKVDLVEQTEKFLHQAKKNFTELGLGDRVDYVPLGLQHFTPYPGKYGLIWCQWVLSHLNDPDLIAFLKRCSFAAPFIGVKENQANAIACYDEEDSSKTRSEREWRDIFEAAGLIIVKETKQMSFPDDLFDVKMYLLMKRP